MSESESFCLLLSHGDSASDDVGVLKMSRGCAWGAHTVYVT